MNRIVLPVLAALLLAPVSVGANEIASPAAELKCGVLLARLVELTDRPEIISLPDSQRLVDQSFESLETTAASDELRADLVRLRARFTQIPNDDARAEDLKRLDILRTVYLTELPAPAREADVLGETVQQIYYNATVLKDPAADMKMRTRLGKLDSADRLFPGFGEKRRELTRIDSTDLAQVATEAKSLIDQITT